MQLRYLETENFLSHTRESVAFPASGIFLLAGESGAGKSSFIVDAVAFALYGAVATRARRGSDLINHSHPGEGLTVRATFDFADGRRLTVARGIDSRGSSWAQIYQPDRDDPATSELLAEGASPVGQMIRRELGGMTWQQFHAAFVARQSEIAMLTSLRGSERKLLVQRMLGMRELEKAGEMVSERLRRTNAEREQMERSVGEFDLIREKEALEAEETSVQESRERVDDLHGQAKKAKAEQKRLQGELTPLRKAAEKNAAGEALRREHDSLREAIPGLERALELHREAETALATLPGIEASLSEAESERDRLREIFRASREKGKLEEKAGRLGDALKEKLSRLRPCPGQSPVLTAVRLAEARELAGVASSGKALHEKALAEKEAQLERLQNEGECYVCQRSFASEHDHRQVIGSLEAELETLRNEISRNEDILEWFREVETPLAEAEKIEDQLRLIEERLTELDEAGATDDIDLVLAEGERAGEQLRSLEKRRAEAEALKRDLNSSAAADLRRAEKRLSEIGDPKEPEPLSDERLETLEAALLKVKEMISRLAGQTPEAERALHEASRALEHRREALAAREREAENLDELRKRVAMLERLQTFLKAYGKYLSHEIRPALEEIGSEMIRRVSGGKHVAMHIDDDYEIELEEANGQRLRASMISGGESIRANICLRLALTRLVTQRTGVPVGFLVFDEPLPSQDPGHVERIMELLDSLRPFYPQQFVISHVGDLRSRDEVDYLLEFGEGPLGLVAA